MEKEGGNRERMRKCRESISLHFLIFSPFPPHFLILSPFPLRFLFISSFSLHFLAARLQGCNDSCSPGLREPKGEPDQTPCSRPLCKCADFGAVEPRNLGDFRSNFNGGEILRASLLLSPRLIFSSK